MALKRNIFNRLIFLMRWFLKELNGHTSNQMKLKKVRQRFTTLLIYSQFLSFKALAKRAFMNFGKIGDLTIEHFIQKLVSFFTCRTDLITWLISIFVGLFICQLLHISVIFTSGHPTLQHGDHITSYIER